MYCNSVCNHNIVKLLGFCCRQAAQRSNGYINLKSFLHLDMYKRQRNGVITVLSDAFLCCWVLFGKGAFLYSKVNCTKYLCNYFVFFFMIFSASLVTCSMSNTADFLCQCIVYFGIMLYLFSLSLAHFYGII